MRVMLVVIAIGFAGCGGDGATLPTCASLGCQVAASGTPGTWAPCFDEECWCDPPPNGAMWVACSRSPCAATAPRCPPGMTEGSGAYYEDGQLKSVCFCDPD